MKKQLAILAGLSLLCGASRAADDNAIVVDGSTTVGPIAKAFAEFYMNRHPGVNITVSESGSGNGAKSLMNASCDVATMSRPMKSTELKSMEESGRLAKAHIVAMDGLAIAVHPGNPLKGLMIEQIRGIFTGTIRNWKELGGPDRAIVVISRDTNSGTYECFETLVMNKGKMFEKTEYVGSNGAVRQRVMDTPAAIGYVGLAFTDGVKTVAVNNIEATPETVLAKKYPIARPLYFYTNGSPKKGSNLEGFVNLYTTEEGRKIIADTGFVPLAK